MTSISAKDKAQWCSVKIRCFHSWERPRCNYVHDRRHINPGRNELTKYPRTAFTKYQLFPCFLRNQIRKLCMSHFHYDDVIMGAMASQIISLAIEYSTVCSAADQRKHQSSTSMAFLKGINRWSVNSPHKRPVTRKMFPIDYVIMPL